MHNAPLEAHEQAEHLEGEGHGHDRFVSRMAVLVASLAAMAAVSGNLESIETEKALATTSEATLKQDEATDAWAEFEADSIKKHLYTVAGALNPTHGADYAKTAKEESAKQAAIKVRAEANENERKNLIAESAVHEGRHHWLTGAATLFEIAIALATVSLVTRRSWLWMTSSVLGIGGVVLLAKAFV